MKYGTAHLTMDEMKYSRSQLEALASKVQYPRTSKHDNAKGCKSFPVKSGHFKESHLNTSASMIMHVRK